MSAAIFEQSAMAGVADAFPERMSPVIAALAAPVSVYDASGRLLAMSAAAREMHGPFASEEAGADMPAQDDLLEVWQGSRRVPETQRPLARALRGEVVRDLELRVKRRDTGREWIGRYTAEPVQDAAGELALVVVSIENVTHQKEQEKSAQEALRRSEERYRSLIAATTSVVWISGPTGEFLEPQPGWEDYTGQPWSEHRGLGWQAALHPDDREQMIASWAEALKMRVRYLSTGRLWHAESGRHRYFEARAVPIFEPDGSIREWVGTIIDTEEQRLAQEAEHQARREAEAANRTKDEFLAVLSHELRTPLTPAFLSIDELMEMPNLPEAVRTELGVVRRNLGHETKLIDDLLDMTRIQSGKLEMHSEVVDLHEVLRETAQDCLGDSRRKNIKLEVELEAPEAHVQGDAVRLRQIFWNLLRNAVKFTAAGGKILLRSATAADGQLLVSVRDTGIGIPAELLPRVFSRFEQGGVEVTRRFGGLGLGLAITKSLVELHGATISADSGGPGEGSTFFVQLPTVTPVARVQPPGSVPARPAASGVRILLVEDHDDTRITLARLLKRQGHEVLSAGSVSSALIVGRAREFDLLISDIGLPDGTGLDLLRQMPSGIRAVSLSGFGMEKDVAASKAAGFAAHLTKPVDFERLTGLIRELAAESVASNEGAAAGVGA